jgi:hypothetical protein
VVWLTYWRDLAMHAAKESAAALTIAQNAKFTSDFFVKTN